MKKFLEEIKMTKKLEYFLLLAVAAMMLLVVCKDTEVSSNLRTETERRLISAMNRIEGAGKTDVLVVENDGQTCVLVVSEGADDMNVYLHILQAVRVMFDIELENIEIIPHKG